MNRWDKLAEGIALVLFAFGTGVIWVLWMTAPYQPMYN